MKYEKDVWGRQYSKVGMKEQYVRQLLDKGGTHWQRETTYQVIEICLEICDGEVEALHIFASRPNRSTIKKYRGITNNCERE